MMLPVCDGPPGPRDRVQWKEAPSSRVDARWTNGQLLLHCSFAGGTQATAMQSFERSRHEHQEDFRRETVALRRSLVRPRSWLAKDRETSASDNTSLAWEKDHRRDERDPLDESGRARSLAGR